MGILQSILDDAEVSTLHPFVQPVVPMILDDWQAFGVELVRGGAGAARSILHLGRRGAEQPGCRQN